ncbi:MAG: hemolysin family protein [Bacteroidota bacterium]
MDPASSWPALGPLLTLPALLPPLAALAVHGLFLLMGFALMVVASGAEKALLPMNDRHRSLLDEVGGARAKRLLWLLDRRLPVRLTLRFLYLLPLVGVALLAMSTARLLPGAALAWALGLLAVFVVVLIWAERLMRRRAKAHPIDLGIALTPFVMTAYVLLWPVTKPLAELLRKRPDPEQADRPALDDDDTPEDGLDDDERALLTSLIEFGDTTVREVMISRLDVQALDASASLEEAVALVRASGHSRFPVYDEHLDRVLGVVFAKDLLRFLGPEAPAAKRWVDIARRPLFVPEDKRLDEMLALFRSTGTHIAIVVDEYGGTAGLVTLEDILEEIVGDIRDEHDAPEPKPCQQIADNLFRIDARIHLEELAECLETDLDAEAFDFESLGGLVFHLAGAVPDEGDTVRFEDLEIEVESVEQHRIRQVLVRRGVPVVVEADTVEVEQGAR